MFCALANDCQEHLNQALREKDQASFLVSGGITPAPLYSLLSQRDLEWGKIQVALVDERWVWPHHEASNEAFIRRNLLIHEAEKAPFTGMKNPAKSASEGRAETEERYRKITQPFSLTILGMGLDGHTASLFPHAQALNQALNPLNPHLTTALIAEPSPVTGPYIERLSLTLAGLLRSTRLVLLLTGVEKLEVYRRALTCEIVEAMPVSAILGQDQVPVDLYWAH